MNKIGKDTIRIGCDSLRIAQMDFEDSTRELVVRETEKEKSNIIRQQKFLISFQERLGIDLGALLFNFHSAMKIEHRNSVSTKSSIFISYVKCGSDFVFYPSTFPDPKGQKSIMFSYLIQTLGKHKTVIGTYRLRSQRYAWLN